MPALAERRRLPTTGQAARVAVGFLIAALAGCAGPRVVPVPGPGVTIDPGTGAVTVAADDVVLAVRPSAWDGSPGYLPSFVTPLLFLVTNRANEGIVFDHADLRLFDESRFQYTALAPVEVERILRAAGSLTMPVDAPLRLAAAVEQPSQPVLRRRVVPPVYWDPWWSWPAYPYGWQPRLDDIYLQALRVGTLDAGARAEGFVYFPRLREEASRLWLEFHYRRGGADGSLAVPLAVERGGGARPFPPP